jgi:topoisomerase-4 subunit A
MLLEKFDQDKVDTAVYKEAKSKLSYLKRFKIETSTVDKKFLFISDTKGSGLLYATTVSNPEIRAEIRKKRVKETRTYDLAQLIDIKGWKAIGNRLSSYPVTKIESLNNGQTHVGEETEKRPDKREDSIKAEQRKPSGAKKPDKEPEQSAVTPRKAKKNEKPAPKKKQDSSTEKAVKQKKVVTAKKKSDKSAAKQEKQAHGSTETFHTGDTVELDLGKGKDDAEQLDLFK